MNLLTVGISCKSLKRASRVGLINEGKSVRNSAVRVISASKVLENFICLVKQLMGIVIFCKCLYDKSLHSEIHKLFVKK